MDIECSNLVWRTGRGPSALPSGEVHLFAISLRQPAEAVRALREVLSPEEKQRCDRMRTPQDRSSFCVAHGTLRVILGRYVHIPPERIGFLPGPYGKPALDPRSQQEGIAFNLTHSGAVALVALAVDRHVGVDIQQVGTERALRDMALRAFSPIEGAAIQSLPKKARRNAFYACWARKEAAVKAMGGSIALSSRSVVVSADPNKPARLLRMPPDDTQIEWHLHDIPIEQEYAAAVCYSGSPAVIVPWRMDGRPPPSR